MLGDGSKKYQKDRTDHRHHALDAMVISYLHQWTRDKNKTEFFRFPKGIDADYFRHALSKVYPHYITRVKPAIAEQPKSRSEVNKKEFKNISKDPEERGQWYTNKTAFSKTEKGTYQHGYIFYKDNKGKVRSKAIHSFRSPYETKKEVEKKSSEIIGLLCQGKSIFLPSEKQVTATKLGRNVRLRYGAYQIVKLQKETVIRFAESSSEQTEASGSIGDRYRIALNQLEKISICNELMLEKSFDLKEFPASKDHILTGNFRADNGKSDWAAWVIVNTETGEEAKVDFSKLVGHLHKNGWGDSLKKDDLVAINNIHKAYIKKAKGDLQPRQKLPEGYYLIKGFNGDKVELIAQDGAIYRMQSNQFGVFRLDAV